MSIAKIQAAANTDRFCSVFGKSTVDVDSAEYVITQEAVRSLIAGGYGIVHGGYAGGIMQAASDAAYKAITDLELPLERNIAVPQTEHDRVGWERVSDAVFTEPASDIYERLRTITHGSSLTLVGPLGGDGTLLEIILIWHNNVLAGHTGAPVVPMIVLQTENGTDWKALFDTLVSQLDVKQNSAKDLEWLHIVSGIEEFEECLDRLSI